VMAVMGEQPAQDPSALRPLVPNGETGAPPRRVSIPAADKPAPSDSRPSLEAQKPEQGAPTGTPPTGAAQAGPSRAEQASSAERDALKFLAVPMYREALEKAKQCLQFDENSATCHLLAADAHFAVQEFSSAADRYRSFLALAPEDPRAVMANIRLRAATEMISKPQKADTGSKSATAAPAAAAKNSSDEEAAEARADATKLLKNKMYPEARNRASRCIELTPNDAECQLIKGLSYAHENSWMEATPFLKRFLELAPDHRMAPKIRDSLRKLEEQDRTMK
jgi:tetratricopeptide (TPR) repeat protein